jgi:hypothetical protein
MKAVVFVLAIASGPTIQERIDALPPHSGGVVDITSTDITEPIRIVDRSYVTVRGQGTGVTGINARLSTPGPAFYIAGSSVVRLLDFRIQGITNTECGVLLCRTTYNGRGASNALDRLNIQGDFLFGCVVSIASENLEIRDCRLNPRLPNSFGWWTGTTPPTYRPPRGRPKPLSAPGPVAGGTNSGVWMGGRTYVASNADGVTSVHLGDGTVQGHVTHVFISNSAAWNPLDGPRGEACLSIGKVRNVVLDNVKCESADARYGMHVKGVAHGLTVRNGRFGGRVGLYVGDDGGLVNSVIERSTALTTFGNNRKPIKIDGVIQGTVLDIGAYVD